MREKTIEEVKEFWEKSPLWTGESAFDAGTREFFEEHRRTVVQDCFAGELDPRIFPEKDNRERVLDLGCGPGFWTIELFNRGCTNIVSADLTQAAVNLTRERCQLYGIRSECRQENAEKLGFSDSVFTHVNCQGVIHHSPDTPACVREIARVLKSGGTASVSVYYKNIFLKGWPILKWPAKFLSLAGAKLKGRGRDDIYQLENVDQIVRLYDGDTNPVGKAYSEAEFRAMVEPYFEVTNVFLHFFPARTLPFKLPRWLHRMLDKNVGFLIYFNLKKKAG